MATTHLLVAVRREHASRYYKNLSIQKDFKLELVSDLRDALDILEDRTRHTDVFVIDQGIGDYDALIVELRELLPRLLIVIVDEDADFALPGRADDISTDPFSNGDLVRRIVRLMSDRQLETLRADVLPPVREFARKLRTATGETGKAMVACVACCDLGFEYVAFYRQSTDDAAHLTLLAHSGAPAIKSIAPKTSQADDLMEAVLKGGQVQIAKTEDAVNYPLVARGRLGMAVCVPCGGAARLGVLVACAERPDTIMQQQILMVELVSAQLGAALAQEQAG